MQYTEGSSFVTANLPIMEPKKIKLKEKTQLSLNGVTSKEYPKGEVLSSRNTRETILFSRLIESGKADEVGGKEEKSLEGQKTKEPDEKKSESKDSGKKSKK